MNLPKSIFITILIFIGSCSEKYGEALNGPRGEDFKLADIEKHRLILAALEERGIPYELRNEGMISYPVKRTSEVLGLKREIINSDLDSGNIIESRAFVSVEQRGFFVKHLSAYGIKVQVIENDSYGKLIWDHSDGSAIDVLVQEWLVDQSNKARRLHNLPVIDSNK